MTNDPEVYYMAHPIAGDVQANIARAKLWLRWLSRERPDRIYLAPYLADLEILGDDDADPEQRRRGLVRCATVVRRCDGIVLVGGRITAGMEIEMVVARRVEDLTHLGKLPPDGEEPGDTMADSWIP